MKVCVNDLTLKRSVSADRNNIISMLIRYDTVAGKIGPNLSTINPYGENTQNKYTIALLDDKIIAAVDLRLSKQFEGYELSNIVISDEYEYEDNFRVKLVKKMLDECKASSHHKIYFLLSDADESQYKSTLADIESYGFRLLMEGVYRNMNRYTESCVTCSKYKTDCKACRHDLYIYTGGK